MTAPNALFLARWEEVWQKNASSAALRAPDGSVSATFAAIEAESRVWQKRLRNLPERSAVGVQMRNHPDWPALLLALWRANHIVLPLDASLQAEPTRRILTSAAARMLIDENGVHWLEATTAPGFLASTALCKITSGTTGLPRLVEFSCDQLLADSENICAGMGLLASDLNYGVISFSHSYGFSNLLTPLLTRGIPLVVAQENLPAAVMEGIQKTGATVLPGIPVYYQSLARMELRLPPSIRLCITAGAPLPAQVNHDFFRANGRKIHSFYGASESGGMCYDASEERDLPDGFVGPPLAGVNIEYFPETRRIAVRSAAIGSRYYGDEREDVLANGIFRPADLLQKSAAGYTTIGRDSDFINIAGKKLDAQMVQALIEKIPEVGRCVVFAIPHARRGELAIAAVETNSVSAEEIRSICRQKLAPWQVPSDFWICEQIPVSERGKINRRELAQVYLQSPGCLGGVSPRVD